MKEKQKNIIVSMLILLIKDVIIAFIVSAILGTFLCSILWNLSFEYYINTFIGGFFGSMMVDIQDFFKERKQNKIK